VKILDQVRAEIEQSMLSRQTEMFQWANKVLRGNGMSEKWAHVYQVVDALGKLGITSPEQITSEKFMEFYLMARELQK
jgi:hypothetical protein